MWNPAPENLKGLWGQTVWHPWDDSYYYGFFGSPLPDWNFTNPDVTEEMYNVTKFWLEETGIDGFRLDAIRYLIEEEKMLFTLLRN